MGRLSKDERDFIAELERAATREYSASLAAGELADDRPLPAGAFAVERPFADTPGKADNHMVAEFSVPLSRNDFLTKPEMLGATGDHLVKFAWNAIEYHLGDEAEHLGVRIDDDRHQQDTLHIKLRIYSENENTYSEDHTIERASGVVQSWIGEAGIQLREYLARVNETPEQREARERSEAPIGLTVYDWEQDDPLRGTVVLKATLSEEGINTAADENLEPKLLRERIQKTLKKALEDSPYAQADVYSEIVREEGADVVRVTVRGDGVSLRHGAGYALLERFAPDEGLKDDYINHHPGTRPISVEDPDTLKAYLRLNVPAKAEGKGVSQLLIEIKDTFRPETEKQAEIAIRTMVAEQRGFGLDQVDLSIRDWREEDGSVTSRVLLLDVHGDALVRENVARRLFDGGVEVSSAVLELIVRGEDGVSEKKDEHYAQKPLPYSLGKLQQLTPGGERLDNFEEKFTHKSPEGKKVVTATLGQRTGKDFGEMGSITRMAEVDRIKLTVVSLAKQLGISAGEIAAGGKFLGGKSLGDGRETFGDITVEYPEPGSHTPVKFDIAVPPASGALIKKLNGIVKHDRENHIFLPVSNAESKMLALQTREETDRLASWEKGLIALDNAKLPAKAGAGAGAGAAVYAVKSGIALAASYVADMLGMAADQPEQAEAFTDMLQSAARYGAAGTALVTAAFLVAGTLKERKPALQARPGESKYQTLAAGAPLPIGYQQVTFDAIAAPEHVRALDNDGYDRGDEATEKLRTALQKSRHAHVVSQGSKLTALVPLAGFAAAPDGWTGAAMLVGAAGLFVLAHQAQQQEQKQDAAALDRPKFVATQAEIDLALDQLKLPATRPLQNEQKTDPRTINQNPRANPHPIVIAGRPAEGRGHTPS